MDIKPEKALIMGCGDVGFRLAGYFSEQGWDLHVQLRSDERANVLRQLAAKPIIADLDEIKLPSLPMQDALVYYFIPPQGLGQSQNQAARDFRLERFLQQAQVARHIVYISTTGVYGHCNGEWVSEQCPLNAQTPSSLRRVAAEQVLYDFHLRHQVPVTILRVAAIYSRGRLPVERLRRGDPVLKKTLAPWSNRIHIDDLIQVCIAAGDAQGWEGVSSGGQYLAWQIYNVSDGQPSTMTDYFLQVAALLGLPRPKEIGWSEAEQLFSPAMLAYLQESKRIDNHRMMENLNITLRYPSYKEGLPACIESGDFTSKT